MILLSLAIQTCCSLRPVLVRAVSAGQRETAIEVVSLDYREPDRRFTVALDPNAVRGVAVSPDLSRVALAWFAGGKSAISIYAWEAKTPLQTFPAKADSHYPMLLGWENSDVLGYLQEQGAARKDFYIRFSATSGKKLGAISVESNPFFRPPSIAKAAAAAARLSGAGLMTPRAWRQFPPEYPISFFRFDSGSAAVDHETMDIVALADLAESRSMRSSPFLWLLPEGSKRPTKIVLPGSAKLTTEHLRVTNGYAIIGLKSGPSNQLAIVNVRSGKVLWMNSVAAYSLSSVITGPNQTIQDICFCQTIWDGSDYLQKRT